MEKRKSLVSRFLDMLEVAGNKLPDPIFIFISLSLLTVILSYFLSKAGVSVSSPVDGSTIAVENLLSKVNLGRMVGEATKNFTAFPALGVVLVVMLGIGLAENSGYFEVLIKHMVTKTPEKVIIPVLILIGIIGNAFGDAAPIVLPPLAAIVFIKLGYHPIAGMVMVYAASLGAFAANLMLGMSDALVFAFTEPSAQMIDPNINLNAAMNYYFIAASTPVLLVVIYYIVRKYTIPRFGNYELSAQLEQNDTELVEEDIKALKYANIAFFLTIALIAAFTIPKGGFLRNPETGSIINKSPFMDGIGILISILFFVPGAVFGIVSKRIKGSKDLVDMMSTSMEKMAGFIVIVFFASQMMAYFNWSNLGSIIAIKGAELLKNSDGVVLIIGMIIFTSFVNIFIGSASAKWALLAPIFVPMFMLLGFHPGFTQMIYRIGDGITNPITPMLAYLPLLLAMAQKYDKKAGMGTLISGLLPYSVGIGIFWTILIIIFYIFKIPVGPNTPVML